MAASKTPFHRQLLASFLQLILLLGIGALPSLAFAVGEGATAIAAAGSHTCALTSAGGVLCWGYNSYGQLGDNTTVQKLTPVAVSGLSSVTAIAVGDAHSCALTSAGAVKCWGYNGSGQLGDNTQLNKLTPVAVSGLSSGVAALTAGSAHTCALTSAGGVQCWGKNGNGQLGDNTKVYKNTPVAVSGLSSGVVAVTAGGNHTCALTSAGGVQCWGWNFYGQLGDNTTANKLTPVVVSSLSSGVAAIAAGYYHTCALTSAGGVKCWGGNDKGQLGDNTTVYKLTPVAVSSLISGVAAAIAAGYYHTCALTSAGGVKCWGSNPTGQLGDNTQYVNRLKPVAVSGLSSGVVAVAAGSQHSCALTSAGGVKCWGWNPYGQLGDNTIVDKLTPINVVGFDTDGDGILDNVDPDDDNDGLVDGSDNCPITANADQADTDGDGLPDACTDTDDDNDGVLDTADKFPLNAAASVDLDKDGFAESWNAACNATCQANSGLVLDNCPNNANADQLNTDGDAQGNVCDADDDNDGVPDTSDAFPLNAAESVDTDGDGIGNNADPDDDGDGVPDYIDANPLNAAVNTEMTLPLNHTYKGSQVRDVNAKQ